MDLYSLPTYPQLSSGIVYTELKKDNLWDKYCANAPPQHKCPTTTHKIRTEIQQSKESVTVLAKKFGANIKTVINGKI